MGNYFSKEPERENKKEIDKNIKELVFNILKNKNINLSFLPDSIERKLYENLLSFGIEEIKELISTVRIQFLNYEITLNMHPLDNNANLNKD